MLGGGACQRFILTGILDVGSKQKNSDQGAPKFDEDGVLINLPFAMTMPCFQLDPTTLVAS